MTIENDTEKLNDAEHEWIAILNTYEDNFHYNLTPGGDFNPMKVPEIAAKISGENNPWFGKKGEEAPFFGHKHTSETKEKISKARSGKKLSEEHKKKISKAHSGKNHPMYDKKHTQETKEKMSSSQNTIGYFRVSKKKDHKCKQGFRFCYQYYDENNKQRGICSVDIKKLEKKVKDKGLPWLKLEDNNDK